MAEPRKDILNNLRAFIQDPETSVPPSTERSRRKRKADDEEAETVFKRPAEIYYPQKVTRRSSKDLTAEGPAPSRTIERKREASDAEAGAGRPAKVARQSPPPPTSVRVDEAEQREEREARFDWWQLAVIPKPGDPETSVPPSTERSRRKRKADDEEAETVFKRPAEIYYPQKVTRRSSKDLTAEGPAPSRTIKRKREASDAEAGAGRPAKVAPQSPPPPTSVRVDEAEQREEREARFDWWQLAVIPKPGDAEELDTKYEQRSRLGEGGFSSVFSGVRRSDQLPVSPL